MSGAHLNGLFGKAIYACKKQFYQRVKAGADLSECITEFLRDLEKALREIASKT